MTPARPLRPLRPLRQLVFQGAIVEAWPDCTRLVLGDGSALVAAPQWDAGYLACARFDGFTGPEHDARWAQSRLHDPLHAWVAQLLRAPAGSPTLAAVAHHRLHRLPWWVVDGEEALVRSLTRYVLTGRPDPLLAPLVIAGADLEDVRQRARAVLLDGLPAPAPGPPAADAPTTTHTREVGDA